MSASGKSSNKNKKVPTYTLYRHVIFLNELIKGFINKLVRYESVWEVNESEKIEILTIYSVSSCHFLE